MRWCAWCNTSFGEQEREVVVDGKQLHERCEQPYRKDMSDRMARAGRRLHIPSLARPCADEQERWS